VTLLSTHPSTQFPDVGDPLEISVPCLIRECRESEATEWCMIHQLHQSVDWVLSQWVHFTVHSLDLFVFICVYFVLLFFILHISCVIVSTVGWI